MPRHLNFSPSPWLWSSQAHTRATGTIHIRSTTGSKSGVSRWDSRNPRMVAYLDRNVSSKFKAPRGWAYFSRFRFWTADPWYTIHVWVLLSVQQPTFQKVTRPQ